MYRMSSEFNRRNHNAGRHVGDKARPVKEEYWKTIENMHEYRKITNKSHSRNTVKGVHGPNNFWSAGGTVLQMPWDWTCTTAKMDRILKHNDNRWNYINASCPLIPLDRELTTRARVHILACHFRFGALHFPFSRHSISFSLFPIPSVFPFSRKIFCIFLQNSNFQQFSVISRNSGKIPWNLRRKMLDLLKNPQNFAKVRKFQRKLAK